jgi:hypothetical protein
MYHCLQDDLTHRFGGLRKPLGQHPRHRYHLLAAEAEPNIVDRPRGNLCVSAVEDSGMRIIDPRQAQRPHVRLQQLEIDSGLITDLTRRDAHTVVAHDAAGGQQHRRNLVTNLLDGEPLAQQPFDQLGPLLAGDSLEAVEQAGCLSPYVAPHLANVQRHNDRVGHSFDISTDLAAPAEAVWKHATGVPGVNHELLPLMRMTVPDGLGDTTLDEVPLGQRVARSWVLLFGIVPVDYDDLTIVERGPGYRFLENSKMLTQSSWSHERIVEATATGSRVSDHLRWDGRARPLGAMYRLVIPIIFGHRHRRLRKLFGTPA